MSLRRRLARTYARIWRTYRAWAPSVLLLSAVVFLPLGLVDAFLATWLAEAVSNAFLSPVFAVAAVLLSVELIAVRDGPGGAPPLRRQPVAS